MDGARRDRIVKAKNYSKLIENGLFFSTTITKSDKADMI